MASDLQLKVILSALDKASGPLSKIQNTSSAVGVALKATSDRMKALNSLQRDLSAYRGYEAQLASTSSALGEAKAKMASLERAIESHKSAQRALAAETSISRREVLNLHREMVRAKEPSAELSRQYSLAKDNLVRLETQYKGSQSQMRRYQKDLAQTKNEAEKLSTKHSKVSDTLSTLKTRLQGAGIGVDRLGDHERQLAVGLERSNRLMDAQKQKLKALDNLRKASGNLRDAGAQVMDRGRSIATQATVGGAAAGYFFKTQFLDRAAEFETYKTILKTVTGSEKKAAEAIAWVSDFAAKTPYEMGEVLESFTRLKAYGIDPMANGMLTTLGDTASAMGKPVMQAVEAIADAVTGENERLKEFGIKASKSKGQITYEYTNSSGETMTKTVAANNRKLIQSTLQAIWNEKYAGAMDAQSKTWKGMVSNLSDQWERFTNMVMEAGLFDRMKDGLGRLLDTVDQMAANGELAALAERVGKGMLRFADGAWKVANAVKDMTSRVADAVGGWQNLAYIIAILKVAPLAFALGKLAVAFAVVSKAMWVLAFNPVFAVIAAAVAVVAGAAYLIYKNWDKIVPYFQGLWAEIKENLNGGIGGWTRLIIDFSPLGLFYRAFAGVMSYFGVEMPGKFSEFGAQLMQGLVNGITNGLAAAKEAITGAGGAVIGWFKEKLGIRSPSRVFAQLGGFTMAGLARGLLGGQTEPLKAIAETTKRLTQAGALALGAGFAQGSLAFDTRAPISSSASESGQSIHNHHYTINISGSGLNEAQLVDLLGKKLDQIKRADDARKRSRLADLD